MNDATTRNEPCGGPAAVRGGSNRRTVQVIVPAKKTTAFAAVPCGGLRRFLRLYRKALILLKCGGLRRLCVGSPPIPPTREGARAGALACAPRFGCPAMSQLRKDKGNDRLRQNFHQGPRRSREAAPLGATRKGGPETRYAAQTTVASDKSRAEIERTLTRYGATAFMYGWDGPRAVIGFRARDRNIRFVLTMPEIKQFRTSPTGRWRSDKAMQEAWEQACRSAWRALALVIKAKLEAVESKIVTFEDEFLPHVVLPDGSTVKDWIGPQIAHVYASGEMPKLLGGPQCALFRLSLPKGAPTFPTDKYSSTCFEQRRRQAKAQSQATHQS